MSLKAIRTQKYYVIYMVLRQVRAPIIWLISVYAFAILGLVLIPGVNSAGEPEQMSFFHAFYFVSYMATTIGFGELPYPFTDAQRMWVLVTIYVSVITWLYAIGKILTLIQDKDFQAAVEEQLFSRTVAKIKAPFFIICGCGDTGRLLVKYMTLNRVCAVVIDDNPKRIKSLALDEFGATTPCLCADVRRLDALHAAGLDNDYCHGVVALTDSDIVNLKVAITVRLLQPNKMIICRAETHDAQKNMASFNTNHIINPFDRFAERFALAIRSPETHLLYEWITALGKRHILEPLYPPKDGSWILCGYGRFGKAMHGNLMQEDMQITVIEALPEQTGCKDFAIKGRGTEASTLIEAGVEDAVGIIAGTDDDTNNLSILFTAGDINPDLFTVARQNRLDNRILFDSENANIDVVMQRSDIIARDIVTLITNPLLDEFVQAMIAGGTTGWVNHLISRVSAIISDGQRMQNWTLQLDWEQAPAVMEIFAEGGSILLSDLLRSTRHRNHQTNIVPLMFKTVHGEINFPTEQDLELRAGDQLLLFGVYGSRVRLNRVLHNYVLLRYLQTGEHQPSSYLVKWLIETMCRFFRKCFKNSIIAKADKG